MRIAQLHERVHRQQDLLANAYIDAKAWVDLNVQSYGRAYGQDETGIPLYGVDITEENSLLETGQDRWVNFDQRLCGFVLQSKQTVQAGAKVYNGELEIGTITSCSFAPHTDSAVALGYIRQDYLVPRTRVLIRHGEKSLEAMVSFLPIY
jgi:glycine cleavage system aminomethyltransferase T